MNISSLLDHIHGDNCHSRALVWNVKQGSCVPLIQRNGKLISRVQRTGFTRK